MPTVNIVPRADNEGSVGTERKKWTGVNAYKVSADTVNANKISAESISATDIKKEGKSLVTADEIVGANPIRQSNTACAFGDIAYSPLLPSWARIECVEAGITATTDITAPDEVRAGLLIADGDVTWIIDDVRDGNRVGDIAMRHILRDGFIKANGAVLQASDYPRLVQFVIDNNLSVIETEWQAGVFDKYVYDETAGSLRIPNALDRFIEASDSVGIVSAGLPNITGGTSSDNRCNFAGASGAFYVSGSMHRAALDTSTARYGNIYIDASRSSKIYGASTTVQPAALKLIAQIKY